VLVSLTVRALLDVGCDLILYILELVISLYEFYGSCDTGVSVYWIIVVLSYDLFLEFFRYVCSDSHYKVVNRLF
jgi:hypothetical protein